MSLNAPAGGTVSQRNKQTLKIFDPERIKKIGRKINIMYILEEPIYIYFREREREMMLYIYIQ